MTQIVADDVIATFARRQHNWMERVLKGSLDPEEVARAVHQIIDRGTKVDRITFTVTGLGLTGAEWITRLEDDGHGVSGRAHSMITARSMLTESDYDTNHRLEAGKEYKVTLMFSKEVLKNSDRKTSKIQSFAISEFGEQSVTGLKAELAFLIREKFTNDELKAMGIEDILVLHEPITDSDGEASILCSSRRLDGSSWVHARCGRSYQPWSFYCAFVFLQVKL